MVYRATAEFIPLYALYALLFADNGMSGLEISVLLAIWSATAFVFEVPSGAWADVVPRRALLLLSGVLLTAGFATWTLTAALVPADWTFAGFAAGFVLWGISGSLQSGTFEALLYDELTARECPNQYPKIIGYTRAASETAVLLSILAAAPLYAWGGYALVGWTSVAFAALHCLLALGLPPAPKAVSSASVAELEDGDELPAQATVAAGSQRPLANYLTMLRTGVREALTIRAVRGGVLLYSIMYGYTAFDEYFGLLAAGAERVVVPLLVGLTVLGSLAGSALAGRTERWPAWVLSGGVALAGAVFAAGVLLGAGAGIIGVLGFCLIALAYAVIYNMAVVAESRLQEAITGPARATVTSVSGLLAEVVALGIFAFVGVLTLWLPLAGTLALLAIPVTLTALAVPAWLPRRG